MIVVFRRDKWISKGNTLVIGYDVCHPSAKMSCKYTDDRNISSKSREEYIEEPSVFGVYFSILLILKLEFFSQNFSQATISFLVFFYFRN